MPLRMLGCLFLVLTLAAAQERQMNSADHNTGTLDNSTVESETNHALFGNTVVAGWNDTRDVATAGFPGVTSISGFGFSVDGGATWTDGGRLPAPAGQALWGDPAVDVDRNGTFYYVSMVGTTGATVNGLVAYQSTATSPAVTFGAPVVIPVSSTAGGIIDKELIGVDKTGGTNDGRLYAAWSQFTSIFDSTAPIVFSHSTSQSPLAFAAAQVLTADDALHQGAQPAVGPDGTVFVVWGRFNTGITPTQIQLRRSLDGGTTFQPLQTIASITASPGSLTGSTVGISHRTRGFPYIAVDNTPVGSPTRGFVYVVFQGAGPSPDKVDVFFVRSTDGGVNWSAPRCINKAPAVTLGGDSTQNDNWQPAISVSPTTGQITVAFYDRREDPANSALRVYRAISTDGGLVWFNEPSSAVAMQPAAGFDPLAATNYMGDYSGSATVTSVVTKTWGDFRNTCTPPGGATNPCSPAGRGDQDAFFGRFASLSGPDLFIQPWGVITGEGPLWQTPAIFVVDMADLPVNAAQGVVNRLRARVKNIGTATGTGVVIRFRYAPIFVGLTDAGFKEIGTVTDTFSPGVEKVVPINWDLTDTTDTNGGVWPSPISAFQHFCVRVSVELAADVNQANNNAQNNFDDVVLAGGMKPFSFLVGNPSKERGGEFALKVQLPRGYKVSFPDSRITEEKFKLRPGEIRLARIQFQPPKEEADYDPEEDQNAEVSLMRGEEAVGGFTMRLAKGRKDNRWEEFVDRPQKDVFRALLDTLKRRQEKVALSDPERGLIQVVSIPLPNERLRTLMDERQVANLGTAEGRIVLSFRVLRSREKTTRIQIGSVLIVNGPQAVIFGGVAVRSNGRFEKEHLQELKSLLGIHP